jgi:hypothetical protein
LEADEDLENSNMAFGHGMPDQAANFLTEFVHSLDVDNALVKRGTDIQHQAAN